MGGKVGKCSAVFAGLIAVLVGLGISGTLSKFDIPYRVVQALRPHSNALVGGVPLLTSREAEKERFRFEDVKTGELNGQVAIVTGANSGVGFYTAKHLARAGATVVMGCRSADKCARAAAEIKALPGGSNWKLKTMTIDTSSLASVKKFAESFLASNLGGLDILVLNAGIAFHQGDKLTKDGIEVVWETNHLGHFYLTKLLRKTIEETAAKHKAGRVRIVLVSSASHYDASPATARADLTTLEGVNGDRLGYQRYAISKLAQVLMTIELAKQLPKVYTNALHPGVVDTGIWEGSHKLLESTFQGPFRPVGAFLQSALKSMTDNLAWSSEDGALTQFFLAASPKVNVSGKYFHPVGTEISASDVASGPQGAKLARELWEFSEKLIQERMP